MSTAGSAEPGSKQREMILWWWWWGVCVRACARVCAHVCVLSPPSLKRVCGTFVLSNVTLWREGITCLVLALAGHRNSVLLEL